MEDLHPKKFRTYNTSLSSYLYSLGFKLLDIEYAQNGKATFVFQNDSEKLMESVRSFQTCKAEGNIIAYEDARRRFTRIVKNQLPWIP